MSDHQGCGGLIRAAAARLRDGIAERCSVALPRQFDWVFKNLDGEEP